MAGNNVEFVAALYGIALLGGVIRPAQYPPQAGRAVFIIKNSAVVALLTTSDASDYVDFAAVALQHASFLEERW